jgi:hypothetical protein
MQAPPTTPPDGSRSPSPRRWFARRGGEPGQPALSKPEFANARRHGPAANRDGAQKLLTHIRC